MRVCVCVCVDGRARQRTVLALPNQRSAVWWAAQWLWNGRYAWHATWYADDGWIPHGQFPSLNSKQNTYIRSNAIPLGVTFSKAQSSNVSFATFQWKETFKLWAFGCETVFENATPSGIGCTHKKRFSFSWQESLRSAMRHIEHYSFHKCKTDVTKIEAIWEWLKPIRWEPKHDKCLQRWYRKIELKSKLCHDTDVTMLNRRVPQAEIPSGLEKKTWRISILLVQRMDNWVVQIFSLCYFQKMKLPGKNVLFILLLLSGPCLFHSRCGSRTTRVPGTENCTNVNHVSFQNIIFGGHNKK